MRPVVDLRANLASNRNRLTVRQCKIEDEIAKGVIRCRFCDKPKAQHVEGERCHDKPLSRCFYSYEIDELLATREALALIEQLSRLEIPS